MGREIRMVPKGWEHPRDGGSFKPLYDEDYQTACRSWWADAVKHHTDPRFAPGGTTELPDGMDQWWWDWNSGPPDEKHYRMPFASPADHFQIYETVSEGTPCSPVFATQEEMIDWMCQPIDRGSPYNGGEDWQCMQGRSRAAAEAFVRAGSTPSFMFLPSVGLVDGVESLAILNQSGEGA